MAIGKPNCLAKSKASSAFWSGSCVPCTKGAPTEAAILRASILSPSFSIALGDGPTHFSPASITAWANSARSDKKP
ncbi:hypothetical protein D3C80_722840 [compost metagenome]